LPPLGRRRKPAPRAADDAFAERLAAIERIVGVFDGNSQRQIVMQLSNSLQGIIAQELLPAADRTRRVLAYELAHCERRGAQLIREINCTRWRTPSR